MNDSELEQILRGASVPEKAGEYWDQFARQVMNEAARRRAAGQAPAPAAARAYQSGTAAWLALVAGRHAFAITACAICLLVGLVLGISLAGHSAGDPQLALARKCFSEVAALFPNQVQALVLDSNGGHLVLAEHPDVPSVSPLYIKIIGPKGEHRFVTFSGQRIQVNNDSFEVLLDGQGEVLLVGKQSVWSSSDPGIKAGLYRIEARPLPTNS